MLQKTKDGVEIKNASFGDRGNGMELRMKKTDISSQ